jgi:hypothetical protein
MLSVTNCVASHKVCMIVNKKFERMQKVKGGLLNCKGGTTEEEHEGPQDC